MLTAELIHRKQQNRKYLAYMSMCYKIQNTMIKN